MDDIIEKKLSYVDASKKYGLPYFSVRDAHKDFVKMSPSQQTEFKLMIEQDMAERQTTSVENVVIMKQAGTESKTTEETVKEDTVKKQTVVTSEEQSIEKQSINVTVEEQTMKVQTTEDGAEKQTVNKPVTETPCNTGKDEIDWSNVRIEEALDEETFTFEA